MLSPGTHTFMSFFSPQKILFQTEQALSMFLLFSAVNLLIPKHSWTWVSTFSLSCWKISCRNCNWCNLESHTKLFQAAHILYVIFRASLQLFVCYRFTRFSPFKQTKRITPNKLTLRCDFSLWLLSTFLVVKATENRTSFASRQPHQFFQLTHGEERLEGRLRHFTFSLTKALFEVRLFSKTCSKNRKH